MHPEPSLGQQGLQLEVLLVPGALQVADGRLLHPHIALTILGALPLLPTQVKLLILIVIIIIYHVFIYYHCHLRDVHQFKSDKSWTYYFYFYFFKDYTTASSTALGHLRDFHQFKSYTSWTFLYIFIFKAYSPVNRTGTHLGHFYWFKSYTSWTYFTVIYYVFKAYSYTISYSCVNRTVTSGISTSTNLTQV